MLIVFSVSIIVDGCGKLIIEFCKVFWYFVIEFQIIGKLSCFFMYFYVECMYEMQYVDEILLMGNGFIGRCKVNRY